MCGFVISNFPHNPDDTRLKHVKQRGPDHTNSRIEEGVQFTHYLLSLVAPMQAQPYSTGKTTVVFNGEIYNFRNLGQYASEAETIARVYESDGVDAFTALDGEFVIVVFDWTRQLIHVALDTFGTKPISMGVTGGQQFVITSLPSALSLLPEADPILFSPNTVTTLFLSTLKIDKVRRHKVFSLKQHKTHYDDWCLAFEAAVEKRTRVEALSGDQIFIGLSTGHDSGAIAAALLKQERKFTAFSVYDPSLAADYARRAVAINPCADHMLLRDTRNCEPTNIESEAFQYRLYSIQGDYSESNTSNTDAGGKGLHLVCQKAQRQQLKVYLSGSGADEITSDYGFNGTRIYPHSNFGGSFSQDLSTIFPWPSFYCSSMRSYLMKEEYIAGSYGIEGRYPFLDTKLVQAFLSLDVRLKNVEYKAPIAYYLRKVDFPFSPDKKYGF